MKKILKNKKITTMTLLLVLTLTTVPFIVPCSYSQLSESESSTPSEWIKLITETPDGAYRDPPGVTQYPQTTTPSGTEDKTGFSEGPAPYTNHTLWRADIPVYDWNKIIASRGKIYFGSTLDHCYYCLDQNTGEVIWQHNVTGGSQRWPQIAFGLVFIRDEGHVTALSLNNGNKFWTYEESGSPALSVAWPQVFEDGDAVYLSSRSNTTCLKVVHQEYPAVRVMWNRDTIRGRLAYYDHKLYGAGSYSTWASCVDAATGDLIWNFTGTGDPIDMFYPSPTIAYGNVYLGTENDGSVEFSDHVVCLDAETGDYKWTYETDEYFVQSISAGYGNIYIAGGERNSIHCVDGETGQKKWEYNAPGFVDYYDIQIGGNAIYFVCAAIKVQGFPVPGTYPGLVMCLDAITGDVIWSYHTETAATSPTLVDGKIYTQTEEDYVWCFGKGPTTTTTAVTSKGISLGQSTVIYGSVEDMSPFSQQHPELQSPVVAGVPVVLSYVKDGTWTDFATVNTASDGSYMYTLTPLNEGNYRVVARFEGTDAYHWSSAQEVIQVSPASSQAQPITPEEAIEAPLVTSETAIMIAVAIIAIAGIVVFWVLRKRK
ncbi:MAG: PQQ-binding-like beta-propeller repeat protein [Candidatus Bathyarchaeota archaeon]|nr:PQQ-binding-like beta-propeller repeat protein [Candidatus Bathyarchaeum sp.]